MIDEIKELLPFLTNVSDKAFYIFIIYAIKDLLAKGITMAAILYIIQKIPGIIESLDK